MILKRFILIFAIYFASKGCSAKLPAIIFQYVNGLKSGNLISLNNISYIGGNDGTDDIFLVQAEQQVLITIYNCVPFEFLYSKWYIGLQYETDEAVVEYVNDYYIPTCYAQIFFSPLAIDSKWTLRFGPGEKDTYGAETAIIPHIRPTEDKYIPAISSGNESITTNIANFTIKRFDAFGCLFFNENQFVHLSCRDSGNESSVIWVEADSNNTVDINNDGYPSHSSFFTESLTVLHDTYIDCHVRYKKTTYTSNIYVNSIIVRMFLIYNGDRSETEDFLNCVRPTSNDDHEGCSRYASYIYDPTMKNEIEDYCMAKNNSLNNYEDKHLVSESSCWMNSMFAIFICIILQLSAFLVYKYLNWKKNKKTTKAVCNQDSHPKNENRRGSDISDHLYCYVDTDSLPAPKDVSPPSIKPRNHDVKGNNHNNQRARPMDPVPDISNN